MTIIENIIKSPAAKKIAALPENNLPTIEVIDHVNGTSMNGTAVNGKSLDETKILKVEEITKTESLDYGQGSEIKFSGNSNVIKKVVDTYNSNRNQTKLSEEKVSLDGFKNGGKTGEVSFFVKNKRSLETLNKFLDKDCGCEIKNFDKAAPWINAIIDKETRTYSKGQETVKNIS